MARNRQRKKSQWIILIPTAALIAVLGYLSIGDDTAQAPLQSLDPQRTIDFYASNSRTTQFNAEGKIHYILDAEYTEHVQQTDITLLTKPDLKLHQGKPIPWFINGDRGEVSPDGEEVELFENVRVEHHDEQDRPFLLTTDHLIYVFATEQAHTQADVQIDSQHGITTATGMHAYLREGLVKLLSQTRGRYETE